MGSEEHRHPGDARKLDFISRAPTDAKVARVRDVLLVPTTYVEGDYRNEEPAGDEPIPLADGVTLERITEDDAELILNACTHRGHYFFAVRQFGQRYSLVRQVDPAMLEHAPYTWDDEHVIFYAMILSRLVHDNGHSLEFAARVVDHEDGSQQVIPVDAPGFVMTYRLRRGRDWLTADEWGAVRDLVTDYMPVHDSLPWKVSHAFNLSEDAVRMPLLQRALLLISAGLEGLVQSDSSRVAKQFRERLPRLADEVGVSGVDEAFARSLYAARSEAAHGSPVSMFQVTPERPTADDVPEEPHVQVDAPEAEEERAAPLGVAQDLLRAATRKAIQDPDFRSIFESYESVREKWPVEI